MNDKTGRTAELALLQALTALEVEYWHEVDHNWGRNARDFYVENGIFAVGDKTFAGAAAVADFYRWREGRGDRAARHVVSNFRIASAAAGRTKFDCILCLYAADGRPVLPSRPPIMIADIHNECVADDDGRWRYLSHRLVPIFTGGEPATIPQN